MEKEMVMRRPAKSILLYRLVLFLALWMLGSNTGCERTKPPGTGRGWGEFETEQFVFRFHKGRFSEDHRAEALRLDAELLHAAEILQMDLHEKIEYVVAESPEECGSFIDTGPINAYAMTAENRVVSVTWDNLHEAVHVLDYRHAKISQEHTVIAEGLAMALGGNTRTAPGVALMEARHRLEASQLTGLEALFTMSKEDFLRHRYFTYFEAGAFVYFLLDRFGVSDLKDFAIRITGTEDLQSAFQNAFSHSLREVEAMWKKALGRVQVQGVKFRLPKNGIPLFRMDDPAGDDTGDGDYQAPNDRFSPGVFDLTGFEVIRDKEEVFFQLRFLTVDSPVVYQEGGEKFFPGTVIAIGKGDDAGIARREWHGIAFNQDEGFHAVINVGLGLSVCDETGRVVYTTSDLSNRTTAYDAGTITFSLPVDVIGEPGEAWQYFVGVGLMSDRTMNFLYAGPMPVRKAHPVFIRGGNFEIGNPAFIDVLLPADIDQPSLLNAYQPIDGIHPVLPMVRSTR